MFHQTYVGNHASGQVEDQSKDDDAGGKDEEVGEPAEVVPLLVVVDVKRVVLSRVGVEFRQLPKLGLQGAAVPGIKC